MYPVGNPVILSGETLASCIHILTSEASHLRVWACGKCEGIGVEMESKVKSLQTILETETYLPDFGTSSLHRGSPITMSFQPMKREAA